MNNYCTLFDINYLYRGLAMYYSLEQHSSNYHLYIFAFDTATNNIIKELKLNNITVISLKDFEDAKLLEVKNSRTKAEYCWTSTPSTILYCIEKYSLNNCTYIDADIYFFSDPSILIEEMGNKSVLLTEHRYTTAYDKSSTNGKYCVQFMTFKKNKDGLTALKWWRDSCIDWCYARVENGKFGDQKYLDDWTIKFNGIHELKNLGGGVAPWNVQQYNFSTSYRCVAGKEKTTGLDFGLVFYHFHYLKTLNENKIYLGPYPLSKKVVKYIYRPYIIDLIKIRNQIKAINNDDEIYDKMEQKTGLRSYLSYIKRKILRTSNMYKMKYFTD